MAQMARTSRYSVCVHKCACLPIWTLLERFGMFSHINGATETQVSKRVRQWFTGKASRKSKKHKRGQELFPRAIYKPLLWLGNENRERNSSPVWLGIRKKKPKLAFYSRVKESMHTPLWSLLLLLSKQRLRCWVDWDGLDKVSCESHVGGFDIHMVVGGVKWDLWYMAGVMWGWQIAFCELRKIKKTEQAGRRGHRGGKKGLLFSVADMHSAHAAH